MLDTILPLFVGKRTEILTTVIAGLQIASAFGGLDPVAVNKASGILAALAAGTLAAKMGRPAEQPPAS